MIIPGFTAETSLGKVMGSYVLTPGAQAETGGVAPQGLWVTPWGDLIFCYNEGGFSGCFTIHKHSYTLF